MLLGRIVLDLFFQEPVHDAYSIIAGLHMVLIASKLFDSLVRSVRSKGRSRNEPTDTGETSPRSRWKAVGGATMLAINAGITIPVLLGVAFHVYVLGFFDSASAGQPKASLGMAWCYGIVLSCLAYLVAVTALSPDRLSPLVVAVRRLAVCELRFTDTDSKGACQWHTSESPGPEPCDMPHHTASHSCSAVAWSGHDVPPQAHKAAHACFRQRQFQSSLCSSTRVQGVNSQHHCDNRSTDDSLACDCSLPQMAGFGLGEGIRG